MNQYIRQAQYRKGFANIIIIIGIVILAGVVGYFAFVKNTGYPYVLKPLSEIQLSILRSEFTASNGNICAQISEYGFTEYESGCLGRLGLREIARIETADEARVIEMVKDWLVQNSKFTGITKKSDIETEVVLKLGVCAWCDPPVESAGLLKIEFRRQINDLSVESYDIEPLFVFANANGVERIDGSWFPKITVPLEPKISLASAKSRLIGITFTHSDLTGEPFNSNIEEIEEKDLSTWVAEKVIFVKKSRQGLEFHLAWKISSESWVVHIDAITGKELRRRSYTIWN